MSGVIVSQSRRGRRPTRGSVLLGNKGLPRHTFWAEVGYRATLSHIDMQSLYMYIGYPSISLSLSVFPTPTTPPLGWTRGVD